MNSIKYFINGQDIKDTCGVCVSASEGIVGLPKVKKRDVVSWDDYHGEVIDKMAHYYEAREITLSCFIKCLKDSDLLKKNQKNTLKKCLKMMI